MSSKMEKETAVASVQPSKAVEAVGDCIRTGNCLRILHNLAITTQLFARYRGLPLPIAMPISPWYDMEVVGASADYKLDGSIRCRGLEGSTLVGSTGSGATA